MLTIEPPVAEFIAKLGIVEEEADESSYWMELIIEGRLLNRNLVEPLLNESIENNEDNGTIPSHSRVA